MESGPLARDPVAVAVPTSDGGGSTPVDAQASDGGAPTRTIYGVLLSSEALPANFGRDAAASLGVQAVADGACARLAASANLDRSAYYHAILVSERGPTAADALLTELRTVDAGDATWCTVGPVTGKPSCDTVCLVFAGSGAVPLGPANPVISDERGGSPARPDGVLSYFLSGIYFVPGEDLTTQPPRNCNGWSTRLDAGTVGDGGGLPPSLVSFGVGNATATARDGGFGWFGAGYEPCEDAFALPLFCMELP